MRLAAKIDSTQDAIVDALFARGYKIQSLARVGMGAPDLLILTPAGNWRVIEVKSPGGKLTPAQVRWMQHYGRVPVVETVEAALVALEGW